MKYETLTLRLPLGGVEALTAAGIPHGMNAREYARWRLLRALADDSAVTVAAFLAGDGAAAPAQAPAQTLAVVPTAATPAKPAPAAGPGPRPVEAAPAPKKPSGPRNWITPKVGDEVIRCADTGVERSLLRLQLRHIVGMVKARERRGDMEFRPALVQAVAAARAAAGRDPIDFGELAQ